MRPPSLLALPALSAVVGLPGVLVGLGLGLGALCLAGCGDKDDGGNTGTVEADADTDSDTDTDTDADTDSDTDIDLDPSTVQDIRTGVVEAGTLVLVEGLVVNGVSAYGLHAQDPAGGEYAGIYLYGGYTALPEGVAVGDEIRAVGTVLEYDDGYSEGTVTMLSTDGYEWEITAAGVGDPAATVLLHEQVVDQEVAEPWENMRVQVGGAVVAEVDGGYWTLDSGVSVYNRLHDYDGGLVAAGATFETIDGVLWYSYDSFRLAPRSNDDLAGYGAPDITDASIYEVQGGSIAEGTPTRVAGVRVTAVAEDGVYVQEVDGGPLSGLYVYLGTGDGAASGLAEGDEIEALGIVQEIEDGTWLDSSTGGFTLTAAGAGILVAELTTVEALAEEGAMAAYEGVLLLVEDLTATGDLDSYGRWEANDSLTVDDYFGAFEGGRIEEGATVESLTGIVVYLSGTYRYEPRDDDDYDGFVEAPPTGADLMLPGDLVVTEIMYNPSVGDTCDDGDCEWIEVYNASEVEVDLRKLVIEMQDSSGSTVDATSVDTETLVAPGGYAVIAASDGSSWTYGFTPAVAWSGEFTLSNTRAHTIVVSNRDEVLDETALYSVEAGAGVSWQLLPEALDSFSNDDASLWCASGEDADGDGDFGTPGAANGDCLVVDTGSAR